MATIRRAGVGDGAEVARLLRALNVHGGQDSAPISAGAIERDVCGPDRALEALLAEEDGAAVGVATWRPCYETAFAARGAYLSDLYVEASARRQGVGRALLAAVAAEAQAVGAVFLWLTTTRCDPAAGALYRGVCDVEERGVAAYAATGGAFTRLAAAAPCVSPSSARAAPAVPRSARR